MRLAYGPGAFLLLQFRQRTSAPRVFEIGWRKPMRAAAGGDKPSEFIIIYTSLKV
jgi:hypothetical protein